ncbi:DUF4124 domain-containing protein [Luteimonas sp. e5]
MRLLLVALFLSSACVPHAQAQQKIYQWKDAQGRTHYSGTPPASGSYDVRGVRRQPEAAPATAAPAAAANPRCSQARENLKILQENKDVMIDSNGDGTPDRALDTEEHAAQMRLAQSAIEVHCTP